MHDKNTMTKEEFRKEHFVFTGSFFTLYFLLMFKCTGELDHTASLLLCIGLLLLLVPLGVYLTQKQRRNYLSLFVNIAFPFEIYTILAYYEEIPGFFQIMLAIASILSCAYLFLLFSGKSGKHKVKKAFFGIRTISACCTAIPCCFLACSLFFSFAPFSPTVEASADSSLEDNLNTLYKLEYWENLDRTERLNLLQLAANIERDHLGLNHELNVKISQLSGPDTLAAYDARLKMIHIDIDHFNDANAYSILHSLLHEARHAYQNEVAALLEKLEETDADIVKLQFFDDAFAFRSELKNYKNGMFDYEGYYSQNVEEDARLYATDRLPVYGEAITEYIDRHKVF